MKTTFYPASERGHFNYGWLDSHHSFSFSNWHNAEKVHFGALRVLNDDLVEGGKGYDMDPNDNMEIVTISLKGALAHKDVSGAENIIYSGDVQIISTGTGVRHSEYYNASHFDPVNFLQLWVFPKHRNTKPRYERKTFNKQDRNGRWQVVVSPDPAEGGVWINQDARMALTHLGAGEGKDIEFSPVFEGNGIYLFVLEGEVEVMGDGPGAQKLGRRDALGITDAGIIRIKTEAKADVLVIEVPMFA